MTAAFTVILPHKVNDGNNAALRIALDCLITNTANDFKLLIDAAADSPLFPRINRLIRQVDTEIAVYACSDTFLCKAWDIPMLAAYTPETIVTNVIVEPGAIALHHMNICRDYGRKPETFQREAFEAFAADAGSPFPDGRGWPGVYMFNVQKVLEFGGLVEGLPGDSAGFSAGDTALWDAWEAAGNKIVRARSYAFHLQRFSEIEEQEHEKRNVHST